MMKRTGIETKPTATVRPKLQRGAGRWLLLTCEQGHLKAHIPYGDWSDARKKYGRKKATVECWRCFDE
jgi:hypothetical protein